MASINPFSKYVIEECQQQGQETSSQKIWTLEESIFNKPAGEVKQENLEKTSSEMFSIYKYFSDPTMKIKSAVYTQDKFCEIRELFPEESLLQSQPAVHFLPPVQQMIQAPAQVVLQTLKATLPS